MPRLQSTEHNSGQSMDHGHGWILIWAFLISLLIHGVPFVSRWDWKADDLEVVKKKPLSMKFVQRAPRLVKPMELRKRPKVVQRTFTKITQTTRAFKPRTMRTAAMHGGTVLASLARPTDPVDRTLALAPENVAMGVDLSNTTVAVEKEGDLASLDESLLNASDMNYGRFTSFVKVDPKNKKDISGFVKMALLKFRTNFTDYGGAPDWNTSPRALSNIATYLRENSGVEAEHSYIYELSDREIIDKKVALVYMQGHRNFNFTEYDAKNIGEYLQAGGFLLIDDSDFRKGSNFDASARQMVMMALGPGYYFEEIPNNHPLYSCFYTFDGLPAGDDQFTTGFSGDRPPGEHVTYDHLDGVFINGRLAVVISNKSYNNAWNHDPHWQPGGRAGGNPTRQMQLGVNFVVYSMIQPGGFTQQNLSYK
jgi:hypothetical protein